MGLSGFSQQSYPKKIIIDGDTCVIISIGQARKINGIIVTKYEYQELSDTLFSQNNNYRSLVIVKEDQIINLGDQIDLQQAIIDDHEKISENLQLQLIRKEKKIKKLKVTRIVFAVGSAFIGSYLTYKLIK